MKRITAVLTAFTACLACAGSPGANQSAPVAADAAIIQVSAEKGIELSLKQGSAKLPAVQEFYDTIALTASAGKNDQFVVGDNIAGYLEAFTGDYTRGGYTMHKLSLYRSWASFTAGQLNNRLQAGDRERILPYGHKVIYSGGQTEEMALLSGQYALAFRVTSPQAAELGVAPLIKPLIDSLEVSQVGQAIVLSPLELDEETPAPQFMALAADRPFRFSSNFSQLPAGAADVLGLSGADAGLYLRTSAPDTSFTVVLAFGKTKEEAAAQAQKLAAHDALNAEKQARYDQLTKSFLWTDDPLYNRALTWAKAASLLFVVEEFGTGIWAGLPWFRDNWGRDTFIALPGTLLVSGQFDKAKAVLANFARYQNLGYAGIKVTPAAGQPTDPVKAWLEAKFPEKYILLSNGYFQFGLPREYSLSAAAREAIKAEVLKAFPTAQVEVTYRVEKDYGRVPNRVAAGDSIIYNTVDGTPWMLREALEYIRYSGDKAFAAEMYKLAVPYFEGAFKNYVDADGLLTHDDADTWMDARISGKAPWSARGPRAVEIQALWYTALQTGSWLAAQAGDKAKAAEWTAAANKAKASFLRLFWDGSVMADRLRADASRDTKVRPNQLMLVSIPFDNFVPDEVGAKVTKNAVSELLFPYGIASLSQNDPYFHPQHENVRFHHKDAAYHNGTVWGWNAGFTVTALAKYGYQDLAWRLALNLGDQMLNLGTRGNMSELLNALPDGEGNLQPSGTYAQSWSVAEYARGGYQDFLGFKPDLPAGQINLSPSLPSAWKKFYALLPFGQGEVLEVDFVKKETARYSLVLSGEMPVNLVFTVQNADKSRSQVTVKLVPAVETVIDLAGGKVLVNGQAATAKPVQASFTGILGNLDFAKPKKYNPDTAEADWPMLKGKNILKGIVERKEYQ